MLSIEKLNVFYGESQILHDVTLEVPEGQVTCLMGRNGVGKTTMLKAIMGVLRSRGGQITYDNQNITSWLPHRRASSGIAYVPQGRGIFPYLTVRENLVMGLEANSKQDEAEGVEEMYGLFPVIK